MGDPQGVLDPGGCCSLGSDPVIGGSVSLSCSAFGIDILLLLCNEWLLFQLAKITKNKKNQKQIRLDHVEAVS